MRASTCYCSTCLGKLDQRLVVFDCQLAVIDVVAVLGIVHVVVAEHVNLLAEISLLSLQQLHLLIVPTSTELSLLTRLDQLACCCGCKHLYHGACRTPQVKT